MDNLLVSGGGLYVERNGEFLPVTTLPDKEPYQKAYRHLFAFLEKWPSDGAYCYDGGLMNPKPGNPCFLDYIAQGGNSAHRRKIKRIEAGKA